MVDVNRYRPQIEAKLEEQLGRDITLGAMNLTVFPLAFRVQDAVIAEAPEFQTGQAFAQTQTLYVKPKLLALLRRDIEIDSLELSRPSVELVRGKNGTWNFATLATGKHANGQPVSIGELKINDGQVAVTDLQQNGHRTVYDHIDLVLEDFSPDKSFAIQGRAHVAGGGDQTIEFDGTAGPIQRDGLALTPFQAKLELNRVLLAGLQRTLNIEVLKHSEAVLTGKAEIKNDHGLFASNGNLEALAPRIRGVEIGYPITVRYDIQGNLQDKTIQIKKADLNLGKTPVVVNGNINSNSTPAVVDLQLATSRASLAEAARLAAAFGVAFSPDTIADGVLDLNIHARGPVDKPVMDGKAVASDVRIQGGELPQPVRVDKVELSLTPTTIQSNQFNATTGATKVQAQFTLSGYGSNSPELNASVDTGNAQVSELLNIAHAYGIAAVEGIKGSGTAQLNVALSGPIKQTEKLTYSGTGALRNATFEMKSLAKPLQVRNADIRFNANSVILNNVDFSLGQTVARGNVTVHNPTAPRVEFSLAADKVYVPEWQALTRAKGSSTAQSGTASAVRLEQNDLIRRATGQGRVTVDSVVYDDLTLTGVETTVKLDSGVITMSPLTAELYGGQQSGSVVLDTRTDPVTYNVNLNLERVDANRLLSSISPIKDALYGMVSANANTRFVFSRGARDIARSLNGRVSLNLHDGSIANVDVLHQMSAIAQFLRSGKPVDPVTKVTELSGDFDIKSGVAHTNNLQAAMDAGSFGATGTIDLGQQTLNLRVTAILSKDYTDLVGGTRIGGFMTTAVANQNGELVVPMIVTGTFQNPRFAPDLQKVAEMKLQELVPSADDPTGLGIGLLKKLLRQKPDQQRSKPDPQNGEDPLPEILDRIFGGTQKRP